jgi:hypothetical protein
MEMKGTRDFTGRTTHVLVKVEGNKGTMEFWQSYPSFSPRGVESFETATPLTAAELDAAIQEWEQGGGLSFRSP